MRKTPTTVEHYRFSLSPKQTPFALEMCDMLNVFAYIIDAKTSSVIYRQNTTTTTTTNTRTAAQIQHPTEGYDNTRKATRAQVMKTRQRDGGMLLLFSRATPASTIFSLGWGALVAHHLTTAAAVVTATQRREAFFANGTLHEKK